MLQNLDLAPNKFLISRDYTRLVTDICELKNQKLINEIYYRPLFFPVLDFSTVSCFEDYIIPTASYKFYQSDNIKYELVKQNINLTNYIDYIDNDIRHNIKEIYFKHNEVNLAYSGGIDSIVLLSYIISLGLLSRTRIVCFENLSQNDSSCLHVDNHKKERVIALLSNIADQCLGVQWTTVNQEDFIYNIKNFGFKYAKCYATEKLLRSCRDQAFIFGHHGNQLLLHKNIFINEIVRQRSAAQDEFANLPKTYYCQGMINFVPSTNFPGIEHTHMIMRPWANLDGYQGNRIYSPIGSNESFNLMRQLDYAMISIDTVANARVARELIDRNHTELAEYITSESLQEYDSFKFAETTVSRVDLDSANLIIPTNLNHNELGLSYLQNSIEQSRVPIGALMAIQALQWLSQQL
jgi:hypothetical protein